MRIALVLLFSILTGCSMDAEYKALNDVRKLVDSNFTYISDQKKWGIDHKAEPFTDGEAPFSGDCEEFSGAVLMQMLKRKQPAGFYVVRTPSNVLHMLTCSENYCVDNLVDRPYSREEAHRRYIWRK